ncbi:gamma-interferon-inducible protein 16-like isoform X1 [Trichosurus vulpecula]|uniref:gamma-interferon-inducible protein 16-like isoform X1 n=1 Tax=Trichosurus vulpecula TaxID=9337 RepID=UPI00186AF28F|nr:gamma-interferon-inducible protein 16-like isoform X1 [Trichosurus vulpecula]
MSSRLNPTDAMKSPLGEILLKALEELDSGELKKCKFILKNRDLITKKESQADLIDLSDYMVERFGALIALNKIIKVFKDMNLNEAAQTLQKQKAEVEMKYKKKKEKKPVTKNKQAQMRTTSSNSKNADNPQVMKKDDLKPNNESKKNPIAGKRKATTEKMPESKKIKTSQESSQKTEPEAGREDCAQTTPIVVKVLKVGETFEYDTKEGKKEMFHATVANEHEFIRVKVFNMGVKEHINKNNVIEISKGFWSKGFLEINRYSRVQDMSNKEEITVPKNIKRRAGKTTNIKMIKKQKQGSYVDGVYEINKKTESEKCTFFEVKDKTGKIKVVTFGKWAKLNCEIGDKLQLTCFEFSFWGEVQLKSVTHSFIKVIKAKRN